MPVAIFDAELAAALGAGFVAVELLHIDALVLKTGDARLVPLLQTGVVEEVRALWQALGGLSGPEVVQADAARVVVHQDALIAQN